MLAVMSGMLLAALDQTIVATALPRIVSELHGLKDLSWVVTAYLLTSTVAVPISGKLSDIFGRKKLFLIAISIFVLGSALSGLSQNMTELIAFRAFQGIGAGMLMSTAFAVIGDLFTPAERPRWQGFIGAVFGLASVVGPLLGGYLTDHATWRWNFYINVPVGLLALFMISTRMPHIEPSKKRQRIDYMGAGLLAAGLSSLMLAFVWGGNQYAWSSVQEVGMFGLSLVLLVAFWWQERHRAADPILPLDLFKNSIFSISMLIMFLFGMAMFGAILFIPLFAQEVLGRTATNSGVILTPMVLSLVAVSIVTGQLVSRVGKYKILTIVGTAATTAGILWLSRMNPSTLNGQLVERMILVGVGIGIAMPIFNVIVQNAFDHSRLGIVTASIQMFRSIGATIGVAVMGSILNNSLTKHLSSLASDPSVHQLSSASGGSSLDLSNVNVNQLQGVLSPPAQQAVTAKIAALPPDSQQPALHAYAHFIAALKAALSSSITDIFLIAGGVMSIAFIASWFLKEIPLRTSHHHEPQPLVSEGGVPGGEQA